MFPVCVPAGPKSVLAWVQLAPHANMAHTRRPSQRGLGSAINSLYLFVPQENQGRLYFILLTGFTIPQARGPKKHLKRVAAPKHWMLDKLTGVFVSNEDPWMFTSVSQCETVDFVY